MLNTRIDERLLSTLCERVGVAFEVGLDPYRVFERESESRRRPYSRRMKSVAEHVRRGDSLSDAIRAQGHYFPDHFADMIEGGEATGRLDRVLDRSANFYAQSADYRASFRSSVLWPVLQLVLAVLVIGGLIYLPEALVPEGSGGELDERRDLLGLGLVGWAGLKVYTMWVGIVAALLIGLVWLTRNGYLNFVIDWVARVPILGRIVAVFPEARFIQTFSLGIDAGLNATSATELAFRSAGTPAYRRQAETVVDSLMKGGEIHESLRETGLFQRDTLEVVELGEESGRLAEILEKHYQLLKIQVRSSMARLTYITSAVIWATVTIVLIVVIVRIFTMYLNNFGPGGAVGVGPL